MKRVASSAREERVLLHAPPPHHKISMRLHDQLFKFTKIVINDKLEGEKRGLQKTRYGVELHIPEKGETLADGRSDNFKGPSLASFLFSLFLGSPGGEKSAKSLSWNDSAPRAIYTRPSSRNLALGF